jgi:hypothetical protein
MQQEGVRKKLFRHVVIRTITLMIAIVAGLLKWLFLYYLWKQKVFLKI